MVIEPIIPSSTTQAVHPKSDAERPRADDHPKRDHQDRRSHDEPREDARPVLNIDGQITGQLIDITA